MNKDALRMNSSTDMLEQCPSKCWGTTGCSCTADRSASVYIEIDGPAFHFHVTGNKPCLYSIVPFSYQPHSRFEIKQMVYGKKIKDMFGCTCIYLYPHVLKRIEMKVSLSSTPIHSNTNGLSTCASELRLKASLDVKTFIPHQSIGLKGDWGDKRI